MAGGLTTIIGQSAGRPATVVIPSDYEADGNRTYPIVVSLHGYASNAKYHDFYMGVSARSTALGFIAIVPEGLVNSMNFHFWSAGEDPCHLGGALWW